MRVPRDKTPKLHDAKSAAQLRRVDDKLTATPTKTTEPPLETPVPPASVPVGTSNGGGNLFSLRLPAGLPAGVTQKALQAFIASCAGEQWFTGKGRAVKAVDVAERATVEAGGASFELALLDVKYADGGADLFHVPLAFDGEKLADALKDPDFVKAMVLAVGDNATLPSSSGSVRAERTPGQKLPQTLDGAVVKPLGVPQSNVSIKVGSDVMLKAYRKPETGTPIEREVAAHLTTQGYKNTPQLLGTLTMDTRSGPMTIGMLFELVKNEGDGWSTTLSALAGDAPKLGDELALLGTRIGEMHKALGAGVDDPAFKPQPITREDLTAWAASITRELDDTIEKARAKNPALGARLDQARPALLARLDALKTVDPSGMKTRIHGDLHLGQVLKKDGDWMVVDFEGEPARTKEERRGFYTPLRDVAGMLRSFSYAEATAKNDGAAVKDGWARETSKRFVENYVDAVKDTGLLPASPQAFDAILSAVELEKALYEVRYELKSRPQMVDIPASRVLEMAA